MPMNARIPDISSVCALVSQKRALFGDTSIIRSKNYCKTLNMRNKKHIMYTHRMCVVLVSNLLSAP